ncbi:hypothetical protein [Zooshikella sp. RANM57]|uniref:hypothetical protein n=1 Tax=Zooshikella sp. RANM57 TaxID=3425863 RepID=UPI003D6DEA93
MACYAVFQLRNPVKAVTTGLVEQINKVRPYWVTNHYLIQFASPLYEHYEYVYENPQHLLVRVVITHQSKLQYFYILFDKASHMVLVENKDVNTIPVDLLQAFLARYMPFDVEHVKCFSDVLAFANYYKTLKHLKLMTLEAA